MVVDIFSKQLKPKDMVAYSKNMIYTKDLLYGIYTEFNTLLVPKYRMKLQDLSKDSEFSWIEIGAGSDLSKAVYCIKLYNLCKEEQLIYSSVMPIYDERMKSVKKYEQNKRCLQNGDIILGRYDNVPYLYLGRLKNLEVYKIVNGKRIETSTSEASLSGMSFWRTGDYVYLNLSYALRLYSVSIVDLVNSPSLADKCLSFKSTNYTNFSYERQKTVRSNMYYYGHCDMDSVYDKNKKLMVIPGYHMGVPHMLRLTFS